MPKRGEREVVLRVRYPALDPAVCGRPRSRRSGTVERDNAAQVAHARIAARGLALRGFIQLEFPAYYPESLRERGECCVVARFATAKT